MATSFVNGLKIAEASVERTPAYTDCLRESGLLAASNIAPLRAMLSSWLLSRPAEQFSAILCAKFPLRLVLNERQVTALVLLLADCPDRRQGCRKAVAAFATADVGS